jgi:ABC-type transport system involved in multi-copper enzyme maturation permease subunit
MGAMEHNSRTWKQLYSRPLPRWSIYLAKQIIGMGLIGISFIVLGLFSVGDGLLGGFLYRIGILRSIPRTTWAQTLFFSLFWQPGRSSRSIYHQPV